MSVVYRKIPMQGLNKQEFEQELRKIGEERYHDKHPFHHLLHGGKLNKGQVQAWALNRYCYQSAIPRKDANILAKTTDVGLRREWRHRIEDHDGTETAPGGIERWLVLAEGLGLERDYVMSTRGALPATRFACEAYVNFTRNMPLLDAIASSLTELFAAEIHKTRIAGFLDHYKFANDQTLAYFRKRLDQAPRDVKFGLAYVLREADDGEKQKRVMDAVMFKTDMLWTQLDALYHAYVEPGHIPPGAFMPEDRRPA